MKSNKISVENLYDKSMYPSKPFELLKADEFLEAVKFNNIEAVRDAIIKNKKFIYQFDYYKQTAYHWAAKLGYDEILTLLLSTNQKNNFFDNKMRTPLFLAAFYNQKICVDILLKNGADPFLTDISGKKPSEITEDETIRNMLHTAEELVYPDMNIKKNNIIEAFATKIIKNN